ncbi:meiosis-specific protein ASY2-like [Arabidopsis lyrata subsp. lyrata]|uniref:meiosis-specific protein ASY2-like n=1 Tax=Arabidopsis lyrata subsp. lyrata TaxID=81972 RepID=UPI000A29DCDE|nr:meiosis-specific protein ASY2-like [Arabidopsis lyrata subsp. lyrata]|eukprot:XP_020884664.1 meiosis-specific protein ASY2-like [Arabidopsis lyrata subsp. lyrata]
MSNLPSEFREYEADDLEALMGEGTEPQTQTGGEFDLHPQSQSSIDSLNDLRRLCHIPPEVEMVVPEPYESPESGREGYCCAYEIYFKGCGLFLPLPEILLTYLNHLGIAFSQMSPNMLQYLMCTFTVAAEAGYSLGLSELLELFQARESRSSGYYALYPIADRNLIDGLPLKDNAWKKFWFFFRSQIRPVSSVDFFNFCKAVIERPNGPYSSVDPPPAEIYLSSLNARDRRRIREADKKVKDQISQIGKNKKNASSAGDEKVYRKTLLVDDGSLEGSKSMAVTINNAPSSSPAADIMVAVTAEEGGPLDGSSFTKKKKAEDPEPPLQGRSKSTRKAEAISSSLPVPESADIQGRNPDLGVVLREPLSSGMLPPRRPRGNTSRARSSPSSGLATLDVNSIINHYEEEFTKVSKRATIAEGEIEKLQISNQLAKETAGLDSARQKEIEQLEKSGEETRKILAETEQKLKTALADHNFAKGEIELLKSELSKDVRKISHDARKEVKGVGQKFLLAVQKFISADKAWNNHNSERDELKSNLDLIKEIGEGSINLAEEKETVGTELAETEAKLATVPQPYLDLQQFASEFADSPPLTEPNTGLSLDEMMLTGSPSAHFNDFRTNVDKISSERTQEFSSQDPASSLIPEVVLTAQDAPVGGAPVLSQVGDGGGSPMNE